MTASIIIAAKTWQKNLEECVNKCLELEGPEFEILLLLDKEFFLKHPKIKVISTGTLPPPIKRDFSLKYAKGNILAFIDDDAYPKRDWLKKALIHFKDKDVAAVCGPSITPEEDNLRQKASGIIYSSFLVSGYFVYRYKPTFLQQVDDYPSCNFIIRKDVFEKLGGFDTSFWPGEDTKLCLDIVKRLKKKIIYDPQVLVYHHRRALFLPHLRQISRYALHRGYFIKRYPETSLRICYFIPSLFLIGLIVGGFFSFYFPMIKLFYLLVLIFYLILVFVFSILKGVRLFSFVFTGIILTHLTYGIWFLKGLFSLRLADER